MLFVIGIEILTLAINMDKNIKGVNIHGNEVKMTQYADDTTCFLKDIESSQHLMRLLETFSQISGLKINKSKTEAMWLGNPPTPAESTLLDVKWPEKPILALGVYFTFNASISDQLNFYDKLENLKRCLNVWERRNLTLYGRINIVKTLGISKLVFNASVLPIPKGFAKLVDKLTYAFIWKNKPPRIKKSTLIGKKENGGLNMINFEDMEKSIKISWIKRLADKEQASWKIIPLKNLSCYGGSFLLQCEYDFKTMELMSLPEFYKSTLKYWQELRRDWYNTFPSGCIEKRVIWNNVNIKIGGKPIFYKDWFNNGITLIRDLLDENQCLFEYSVFKTKFQIEVNFLKYLGLVNAIKLAMKNTEMINQNHVDDPDWFTDFQKITTKKVRSAFVRLQFSEPTAEYKIKACGVAESDFKKVYNRPFNITKEPKMRMFQYKIVHNILVTNDFLFRVKIKTSNECPYCKKKHTLEHLLFECIKVVCFWDRFVNWWEKYTLQKIKLGLAIVLYGQNEVSRNNTLLNFAIIIAKYHIYASFIKDTCFSFEGFLTLLCQKAVIERNIMNKDRFDKKWKPINTWLALNESN